MALAAERRLLPRFLAAMRPALSPRSAGWIRVGIAPLALAAAIFVVLIPTHDPRAPVDGGPVNLEPFIEADAAAAETPIAVEPALLLECPEGDDCIQEQWDDGENPEERYPLLLDAADVSEEPI